VVDRWSEQLRRYPAAATGLLFLVPFAVFQGTLGHRFIYDDSTLIIQNPIISNPHFWRRIFVVDTFSAAGTYTSYFYRPLQLCVYWLIYRAAGPEPYPFHLCNLLVYAATGWLVYRLGIELVRDEVSALAGALLWLLHPLHVEPVAWISALSDLGAGFFYLLGFLLFLRAEKAASERFARHVLAALAFMPALYFKEMALTFPLMLLAYWFFSGSSDAASRWRVRAVQWLPCACVVGVNLTVRVAVFGRLARSAHFWDISSQVWGVGAALLGQYTKLAVWPFKLEFFRSLDYPSSLRSPWAWLALAGIATALALRKRAPLFGFLLIWWFVGLLPVLNSQQFSAPLLADRAAYLPSVGPCLAVAHLARGWLPRCLPHWRPARLVLPLLGLVMLTWAVKDVRIIPSWHDSETSRIYNLQQSPNSVVLHLRQADVLLFLEGKDAEAAAEYQKAMRLNQASAWPVSGLEYDYHLFFGRIALREGRTAEAMGHFETAIKLMPHLPEAYVCLGSVYFPRQEYAKAATCFQHAVQANPYDLNARFYLGTCWMKLGEFGAAAEQFRAAREVDPTYDQAFQAEAGALEAAGDAAGAAKVRALSSRQ